MPLIRIRDLRCQETEVNYHGPYNGRYIIRRGDLLVGMDGDFDTVKWKGNDALLNQRVCKLISKKPDELVQDFLFYRIIGEIIRINRITAATTVKHLSSGDVLRIKFDLPTKPEQTKIAEVLWTVDQAIEQTEALIAKQQRIKTGLMQDLLTRGIDEHGNIRSEETHQFKDSPLGRIPVEWDVERLSTRVMVKGGKRLPAGHVYAEGDTNFRYLRTMDFINKRIAYASLNCLFPKTFWLLKRYEITDGDIFISIAGVNLGVAGVFRPDFEERTILTENAAKLSLVTDEIPEYFSIQLNGPLIQKQILEDKGIGAGVPKLALHRIQGFDFPWPTKDEQVEIAKRIVQFENCINEQYDALKKLCSLKTALMQDLLTGKVRVTPLLTERQEAGK